TLTFREWRESSSLQNNHYGIPEPTAQADAIAVPEIDVVVMPLVGWQRDGYRLGMGGGFYDRTLADAGGPLRVGLAYACQEIRGLAMQHWDVALQWVLTENGLMPCSQQPRERLTSR
ncbi:MAG TPA: 5-formyltetrahydrofolate cyclo-ligase, partial [Halieaceae bacterium]|nr:5-formyltetrahydrofolate cyclo-ligase [Halieaceae bacterium]